MLRSISGAGGIPTNFGGVFSGELNELEVTAPGAVSPAVVDTGRALAYGEWYQNDAAVNVAIPTPGGATRIDRIVLRKSWAAQTVRITRIAGVEGAGAPSLVQVAGTTWDTPLVQAVITTGAALTIVDERQFLGTTQGGSWDYDSASNDEFAVWLTLEDLVTIADQLLAISSGTGGSMSLTRDGTSGKALVRIEANGDAPGGLRGFRLGPTGVVGPVRAADNPSFKVVTAEVVAGTRTVERTYLGFRADEATGQSDGIYFRSTDSGNWFLVCRSAASETAVDMGVSQNATRRMLEFRVTGGGTAVQGYVNGVATGVPITSNIPTAYLEVLALTDQESAGGAATYHQFDVLGIGFKTGWS